jgi:putative FmdB family regulatory protein
MPTYDYRCPDGHDFSRFFRKISDAAAELPCPECGRTAERRVSGGAGLLFKGSGFYLTDYGKNAHRKPAPAQGGKGGEGKGESASAAGSAEGAAGATGKTGGESKSGASTPPASKPTGGGSSGGGAGAE